MFNIALILLPDFLLIMFGALMRRRLGFSGEFWLHLERFIYHFLFPALLFRAVYRSHLNFAPALDMILVGMIFSIVGLIGALGTIKILHTSPRQAASSIQTGFRFNTYIGIAIVEKLGGSDGLAAFAVLVGVMVPLVNAAAVFFLARENGASISKELAKNPLISATIGGFIAKFIGLELPHFVMHLIDLMANSTTLLGLIAVGAGLQLQSAWQQKHLVLGMSLTKMILVPTAALLAADIFTLEPMYRIAAIALAVLPTASSAYILAERMGGDGKLVASIITAHIVIGFLTLPFFLSFAINF